MQMEQIAYAIGFSIPMGILFGVFLLLGKLRDKKIPPRQ
jgi:lipopolysaccharide export LptBFGC system permease protein LptF